MPPVRSAIRTSYDEMRVNLRFTVIMDDIKTIEGVGEVVRVEKDPAGMGVVFRELSTYSKTLIEKLLVQS